MRQVKLGNRIIGNGHPTFIIAETACSHDGSVEKAQKIIRGAAEAKADAINFQVFSIKDLMVPQYGSGRARVSAGKESQPVYDYLSTISFEPEIWKGLFTYARQRNLLIISTCGDLRSVKLVSKLEPDAYTISAPSLCEEGFVREIATKGKPVFLRIGGSFLGEIERAVILIQECGNSDIILIHGFQNYPTKLENMNLSYMQSLKSIFSLPVGFADHIDAESELALFLPLVALPFGANVIEKHTTHDRKLKGEDFESALNPDEFKKFVQYVREIEKTFGTPAARALSEDELNYRQVCRKRMVASKRLKQGETMSPDKIAFKRSDEGLFPDEARFIIGRKVNRDIAENDPITLDKLL
jgi:sialic acid synthase SpsE